MNGERFLPRLIETLKAQEKVDLEIIVVDRFSKDESLLVLQKYPEIKIISEKPDSGLVAGYHAGSLIATKENFFFCNEDMWFEQDCLFRLEKEINIEERIAVADPWQWSYDEKSWIHGGTRFHSVVFDMNCPFPLRHHEAIVDLKRGDCIPFACAGAFLIHREAYQEIGGWPLDFFLDHEDVDLGIRLWQQGWKSITVPEAKVYHAVGMSNNQVLDAAISQPVKKKSSKLKLDMNSVRVRRFLSGRSSLFIIAVKYFSGIAIIWAYILIFVALLKSLLRLRYNQFRMECLVFGEIRHRLPDAISFRKKNKDWNRKRPGEKFFTAKEFQL